MVPTRVAESAHLFHRGADLQLREGARLHDVAGERDGKEERGARNCKRVGLTHTQWVKSTESRFRSSFLDNRVHLIRMWGHLRDHPILSRVWNVPRISLIAIASTILLLKRIEENIIYQSQIGGRRVQLKRNVFIESLFLYFI